MREKITEVTFLIGITFITIMGLILGWIEGIRVFTVTLSIVSSIVILSSIIYIFAQIKDHIKHEEMKREDLSRYLGVWVDKDGNKRRPVLNLLKRQDRTDIVHYFVDKGGAV